MDFCVSLLGFILQLSSFFNFIFLFFFSRFGSSSELIFCFVLFLFVCADLLSPFCYFPDSRRKEKQSHSVVMKAPSLLS